MEPPDEPINLNVDDEIVPMWPQRLRIFFHNKFAVASVAYRGIMILA